MSGNRLLPRADCYSLRYPHILKVSLGLSSTPRVADVHNSEVLDCNKTWVAYKHARIAYI